jgi:hypothetical protein
VAKCKICTVISGACNSHGMSLPMAVQSKAYVYRRLTAGIEGSNPTEGTDVRLLLCVV